MNHTRFSSEVPSDDAELFCRFLAGDDAAFARFYQRHNRRLYGYCLKLLGEPEAAHDVMQEVWERIVLLRNNPQTIENPEGFLMKSVRNRSLNHLRDKRHHLSLQDLPPSREPGFSPRERPYLEELIVTALERLPIPQREVLILHVYSGYEYAEIARMLETSADNVRMRAMRGRAHLARIMEALIAVEQERIAQMDAVSSAIGSGSQSHQSRREVKR